MPELAQLYVFAVAALVLLLTPGPAVLYVVARSINQGRMAGLVSVLGIEVASLCHTSAAALGLSAILWSSVLAFNVVKYLGAAYLVYLGLRKLFSREELLQEEVSQDRSLNRIFWQGFLVNLLNPKTALFFFAFLPQFVNPARGNITGQVLFLGFFFVAMATMSDGMYAFLASSVGYWLKSRRGFSKGLRFFAGSVYLGLGVTTALSDSSK